MRHLSDFWGQITLIKDLSAWTWAQQRCSASSTTWELWCCCKLMEANLVYVKTQFGFLGGENTHAASSWGSSCWFVYFLMPINNNCQLICSWMVAIIHSHMGWVVRFWHKKKTPPKLTNTKKKKNNPGKSFQSLQSALFALLFGIFKSRVELVQALVFSQGITSKHLIILTHSTNRICSPPWRILAFQTLKKTQKNPSQPWLWGRTLVLALGTYK